MIASTDLVTVTIDGVDVRVPKGTLLVEAAKSIHRDVPVYCYHKKLGPAGLCRVCLVEIEGMPKLQIACNTPVTDGMKVYTTNGKVDEGRRAILEFLLLNHPLDCPICDKGGECDLQDYSMAYGQGASRLVDAKDAKPKAVDLGPTIVLDEERCILCLRCVRFDDIITQEQSLRTEDRGAQAIIATATGAPYVSDFSGNVTELCPVGALTSKTYRFKSRPWDNHRATTTCMQCSVGCQMNVDARNDTILRTMSVEEDDQLSDGWLCDRGRYNIGYVADETRVTQPMFKHNGIWSQISWDDAIALWAKAIKDSINADGVASAGAIGGGRLLNEEAFLLQHVHRALGIENLDWRAGRQQQAHPGRLTGTHVDLENAEVIVTYGRSPAALAPVLDLRIRKAVSRNDAMLISVGDYTASGVVRDRHVTSVAEAQKLIPEAATRIAFVWDGTDGAQAQSFFALAESLAGSGKHVSGFIAGEAPNARGAESVGMLPAGAGLDTEQMLIAARDGKMGVLALFGVNPMLHFPDRELVRAALSATRFVVVSELFMTETADLATLVLPACSAFEKTGTTTDLAGDILPVNAAVKAPGSTLADGDMLYALADALGLSVPTPDEIEQRVRVLVSQPPSGERKPLRAANVEEPADALRLIVDSTISTGGGTMLHDERLRELRTMQRAVIHPQTARAANISENDLIDLAAAGGASLRGLRVYFSERVPAGAISIVDGIVAAPANALGPAGAVRITVVRKASEPALVGGAAGE
ncbi:MAG: NADH-quinone oxidoreductase subunit NuoG [Candidatus Velthaea sp.]